jgi:hypothetical protein
MAKYEDYVAKNEDEPKDNDQENLEELARETAGELEPETPTSTEEVSPELPDKYRNKSLAELVAMHQESERKIGQQGNELGDLRKTVNGLIEQNLKEAPTVQDGPTPTDDVDYFANPEEAIKRVVDNHPDVLESKKLKAELSQKEAQEEIYKRHPDADEVFAEEGFREWITNNPYRQKQLIEANNNFDVEAGDALLSDYKELRAVKKPAGATTKVEKPKAKSADSGSVSNAGQARKGGKVIYRADIRELQRNNPKRYNEMLPEIRQAYNQGRIRDR